MAVSVSGFSGGAAHAASPAPGWPTDPNWQKYLQAPSSPDVHPVAITSTTGDVTNAAALITHADGQVTTLTATPQTITPSPVTVSFPAVTARYVRLDVSQLGLPAAGDPAGTYVQLAELQAYGADPAVNLAAGKPVTASESLEVAGWSTRNLTDGVTDTQNPAAHGWTSAAHGSTDVSASPVLVTVDLGSVQSVSSVVLWPRTDTLSPDGRTASFPVDYSVQTSATDTSSGSFASQKAVTGQVDPPIPTTQGGPASVILDYGHEVGGYPTFDVTAQTGTPKLQAGYSETRTQISPTGDGVTPWASGDNSRYDTYTVSGPGRITNAQIQGGERYEEISVTTPGTVSLSAAGITFTPYLAKPQDYSGYFVSSSDELNQAWYDGAYTAEVNQVPTGTTGPVWAIKNGALDVPGTSGGTGLLSTGSTWTDYTASFTTTVLGGQAGWMVRGQDAQTGDVLILDASNDTGGTPNALQELSESGGNYQTIATVPLASPIDPGTSHAIKEVVSGTTVTTFVDGTQVASFDTATADVAAHPAGTVGFREFTGEEASFQNLSVTSPTSDVLYQNALSTTAAIADFDIPGNNAVPLILDGAKRDRAVWAGDLAVEGPTLFYSTNTSDYIRGSIELLGSYAGSNGYVSGAMPPTTPINPNPPADTKGGYSASYSMYFVRDLAEYYQYTADTAFVQKEWSLVANELAWSAAQVDANGLFVTNNDDGADWDYYDGDKTGEVTEYNALYYQTLLDGADLATATGHADLAAQYTSKAAALKTAINANLFNASTGVYNLSNQVTNVIAQDANVVAIDAGVVPADKVAGILAKIKSTLWTPFGTLPYSSGYQNTISPYVSGFELTARLGAGDTDNALQLLSNEWGPMMAPGDLYTGTFWENESTSGTQASGQTSMAHGWSTMPTSALSKYVLGIQPVTAGYQTWLVQPHAGNLTWTEGQAPTPHGAIVVDWSHDNSADQFALHVAAPSGTSGTIAVPTFGKSIDIQVGGQLVWSRGSAVAGADHVRSAILDGDYVDLTVNGGTYDITTSLTPAATVPFAPSQVSAQPGIGSAVVSWSAPTDDGGAGITGYTVTSAPGGRTCTTTGALSCSVTGLTGGSAYTFTVKATNSVGDSPSSTPSAAVTPIAAVNTAGLFRGVTTQRLVDTRSRLGATGPVPATAAISVAVLGHAGVPATGVKSVVLNVTAVSPAKAGYLSAYASGSTRPAVSNLNFVAGQTVANQVTVPVGADGKIDVFNGSGGTAQILADVSGYYLAGTPTEPGAYHWLTPARILDTRTGSGAVAGTGTLPLTALGHGGIPASGVSAVVLNVTAVSPAKAGYLSAYASGGTRPAVSNLNFVAGQTVANQVTVPVGIDGKIDVFNGSGGTVQILADVSGYYLAGTPTEPGAYHWLTAARILDTRGDKGAPGPVAANRGPSVELLGQGGVPTSGVARVAMNVTAVSPTAAGYLTGYPSLTTRPGTSSLNFTAGHTVANAVTVGLGTDGKVDLFNGSNGTVQLLADVSGYFLG